jgi:hypothetical protein
MDDLLALYPSLHAGKVEIDHWRRIEGQELAQGEAAYHGIAERIAEFGSGPMSEHHRQARKHCRRRRHQDRPEPQQASFPDRGNRRHIPLALRRDGEVVPQVQREQRTDAGGSNVDRMVNGWMKLSYSIPRII